MKKLIVIIAILIITGSASAQVGLRPAAFYVDLAAFASDSSDVERLEVYYKIYTSKLTHILKDGKYFASYSVTAVIKKDKKQHTAAETEGSLYSASYDETQNLENYIVDKLDFHLKPGKYKLEITLNDLNASSLKTLETNINISSLSKKKEAFSNILFASEISPAEDSSAFNKNEWRVIPSVSRRYGDNINHLKFYYEYYNTNPGTDSILITYEIIDSKNNDYLTKIVSKERRALNRYIDSLSLENILPGPYELVITAKSSSSKKTISQRGFFKLIWSALEMVKNDYKTAVNQLVYIANSNEIKLLKDTPKENRVDKWNEFWESRDPSPDTPENEIKDEYYKRIAYANHNFSVPNKSGWRTDMGMTYIIHGEPDDIERYPFELETKPYEIWYFYAPRRRFLFIDVRGYGEYELQYPYDGDISKPINIYGG
ncbi:MAG: GWxTD domain-containing protein [candidate division Zixibacteria bacterium]|nr:GWxTD domain-containing protein [candidate division Zixibacteria bacterium]